MIPVNSIEIPLRFRRLCAKWAGNEGCMLRAVASYGGLTIGTIYPLSDWKDDADKRRKLYLTIWYRLAGEAGYTAHHSGADHGEYEALRDFEKWCDEQVTRLYQSYDLEDWWPSW